MGVLLTKTPLKEVVLDLKVLGYKKYLECTFFWVFLLTKTPLKEVVLDLKILGSKEYLEVLFGRSGAYKSKYTLKPILSKNMVHFT